MKNLVILFLFIVSSLLSAQTVAIKGRNLNSSDKSPISFVNISVKGENVQTTSDQTGYFLLSGKFSKNDLIIFTHVGFETKEIKVSSLSESDTNLVYLNSKMITSQTILVRGTIGEKGVTPLTFSKLDQNEIKKTYTDQDVPELLSYLPSTSFYSENGNGIGYNYLSIRGFDQKRISVAINGIPQNDPEDHNVYWIDFPDLLESTELIQVQRGAGSGIAGASAIGGAINIITSSFSDKPKKEFSVSLGDLNTRKYSAEYSTGLISNKYSFYGKLSQILSSGYRNSSWVNLVAYHLSAVRYDDNLTTQVNVYGGIIKDGLAYTGLPKFTIKDKNLRRANYSYWEASDKDYTYTLERRPNEIENFSQPHFEILNDWKINDKVSFNSALFLVLGNGFFDYDGSWADTTYFRMTSEFGFHPTQNPDNAMIRAMVENKQGGWIPRLSIKHDNGELIVGGEFRIHRSIHWGSVVDGSGFPVGVTPDYRYYYFKGGKNIANIYAHDEYTFNDQFNALAEIQLAYNRYLLYDEKYLGTDFKIDNLFFNPRVGLNFKATPNMSFYVTFSRVSREPRLVNYYDAAESGGGSTPQFETNANGSYDFSKPLVKPETMNDAELGTSYSLNNMNFSLNFYYMLFDNEIVKQGRVDRFGQPITGNMERTLHYGTELSFDYKLSQNVELVLNGSLSKNYISKGITYASYTDPVSGNSQVATLNLADNTISGFPKATFNGILKLSFDNLFVQLTAKYVGQFYTDNYGSKLGEYNSLYPGITNYSDNVVDPYFVASLFASYDLKVPTFANTLRFYFRVTNLFDNLYASNGIGNEFFPAAERNLLVGVQLGF